MKKLLFIILLIWFWPVITASGQSNKSDWVLFSELSPTPRSDKFRILPNANDNFHIEYRNRIGKMVSRNTAIGLIINYRHYNYSEPVIYTLENSNSSFSYDYNVKNNLWGTGAFITRFAQLNNRLRLHASLYGLYEMGDGNYNMILEGYDCPSCFTNGLNFGIRTGDIENLIIKERNFFGGFDLGASYAVNSRISLLTGINILQYEHYSISDGNRISPTLSSSALYRQVEAQGNTFTTVFNRPIFHMGMMLLLNKKT